MFNKTLKKGYSALEIVIAVVVIGIVAAVAFYAVGWFGTSLSGTVSVSSIAADTDQTNLKKLVISKSKVLDTAILKWDTTDATAKTATFTGTSLFTGTPWTDKGILVGRVAPSEETSNKAGDQYDNTVFSALDRTNPTIYLYSLSEIDSKVWGLVKLGTGSITVNDSAISGVYVYKVDNSGN